SMDGIARHSWNRRAGRRDCPPMPGNWERCSRPSRRKFLAKKTRRRGDASRFEPRGVVRPTQRSPTILFLHLTKQKKVMEVARWCLGAGGKLRYVLDNLGRT